ncbi:MAG TPA: uracil-DNA glycosylase [Negativicutes bacterium]|nr:uracil-DNA glycosylase [Negativicutes bacterium]
MTTTEKTDLMRQIENEAVALKNSALAQIRRKDNVFPVIGEGSYDAKIMFVGEAPGKNEAATGRPFCGASGRVLTQMIEHIGMKREEVYITNIVKDRPPDNRDPLPREIEQYAPFLDRQIEVIQPRVIATLGRYSMAYVMNKFGLEAEVKTISQIHGKVFAVKTSYGNATIIPLYHPAVALYQNSLKAQMFKDFEKVNDIIHS